MPDEYKKHATKDTEINDVSEMEKTLRNKEEEEVIEENNNTNKYAYNKNSRSFRK